MLVIQGNKGIFQNGSFAGLNGSIAEDGTLIIFAIAADGMGSSIVTIHEEKLELEEKYRSILEVHLRENIKYALFADKMVNSFKIVHGVEYVHAKLANSQTTPQERTLLTLPEGNSLIAIKNHYHYPNEKIRGPRWVVLKSWQKIKESREKSGSNYDEILRLEKVDGTFEDIECYEGKKRSPSYYDRF